MRGSLALLCLVGSTQAALLNSAQQQDAHISEEELTIKMPESVASEEPKKMQEKPATSGALVQSESQLGMFESGVLHASLKPIVKAKVHKVMNYLQTTKDEYEHGTADQKKEIQQKAEALVVAGAGARGFNSQLCNDLWSESTEMAGYLSFYYCPSLVFPANELSGTPPYKNVAGDGPSRLRSAFLTQYFWNAMLSNSKNQVIDMLGADICYYWGNVPGVCGKGFVEKTLPYIGFPEDSQLSNPVQWHCDTTTCIAPVKAWAQHDNYCLTTFGSGGKVTEAIVPLDLWR